MSVLGHCLLLLLPRELKYKNLNSYIKKQVINHVGFGALSTALATEWH